MAFGRLCRDFVGRSSSARNGSVWFSVGQGDRVASQQMLACDWLLECHDFLAIECVL